MGLTTVVRGSCGTAMSFSSSWKTWRVTESPVSKRVRFARACGSNDNADLAFDTSVAKRRWRQDRTGLVAEQKASASIMKQPVACWLQRG
eukprot:scaffold113050_cov72-Phaeocystis_antarctica.AAC.2